ncbi:hypothetical protein DT23_02195 [Thioclava indica]|uniref:Uncharacterized protein n=1 Tax=Thioclava indica TaxID=1353528 RepID=A0A074JZA1_9RHOB|nr:hypothetical protein DT23_02195 [Thioclava indica]
MRAKHSGFLRNAQGARAKNHALTAEIYLGARGF